jgi:glycosyltransferase involved in cell wall biosynthesis
LNFLLFPNYYGRFSLLKRAYSRAVVRVALTRVAHVIVPSTATREGLLARWPGLDGRVSVIPHGLDPRFLQLPDRARVDSVLARYRLRWHGYFFFLGTDRPHKNLARLVRAFEDLPAEIRFRAPLVLAGAHRYGSRGGSSRDRAEVVQLGYVPVEELPALYHASLAVVLPSFGEGFGLPALEAMASGAALIASNHGAFPELVGDGGLLVDPCSPDSIRNAMENVATRPEVRGQLSLRGRKRSQQFRFEETARSTLALYQQVGAGTP